MPVCLVLPRSCPPPDSPLAGIPRALAQAMLDRGRTVHVLAGPDWAAADFPPAVRRHGVDLSRGPQGIGDYPTAALRYSMSVYDALKVLHVELGFDAIEFLGLEAPPVEGYFAARGKRALGWFASATLVARTPGDPTAIRRELAGDPVCDQRVVYNDHCELSVARDADLFLAPTEPAIARWRALLGNSGPALRARVAALTDDADSAAIIPSGATPRPAQPTLLQPPRVADAPLVSAVVPFYNLGPLVLEAVESLRRQTLGPGELEIIVVNDGSTDAASLVALDDLSRTGIRVVPQPNLGISAARNHGARLARGRYLLWLDADDLASPTLAASLLTAMRREDAAAAAPILSMFRQRPDRPFGVAIPLGIDDTADVQPVMNTGGAAGGTMVRRDVWEQVGGFDESMSGLEDWEFWCRLAAAGHRLAVVPELLHHYRVRPGSKLRTDTADRFTHIKSYILARHAALWSRSTRAIRLQFSELDAMRAHYRWSEQNRARADAELAALDTRHRELLETLAAHERERQSLARSAAELPDLRAALEAAGAELARLRPLVDGLEARNAELAEHVETLNERVEEGLRHAQRAAMLERQLQPPLPEGGAGGGFPNVSVRPPSPTQSPR